MTLTLSNDSRNVLCRYRLKLRYFSKIIYLIIPCSQGSLPIKLFFYCYLKKLWPLATTKCTANRELTRVIITSTGLHRVGFADYISLASTVICLFFCSSRNKDWQGTFKESCKKLSKTSISKESGTEKLSFAVVSSTTAITLEIFRLVFRLTQQTRNHEKVYLYLTSNQKQDHCLIASKNFDCLG